MKNIRNKYLVIFLSYGILINAVTFCEVYFDPPIDLSSYMGHILMAVLVAAFAVDWQRLTTMNAMIKILLLLFILLETYISGVVLIVLTSLQDISDANSKVVKPMPLPVTK
jgi:hypothetical protein